MRDSNGQFLPGESGNPSGRRVISIVDIIKRELQEIPEGEKENLATLMVRKYLQHAYETCDGVALRDIIDRIDGKPRQNITVSNDKDAEWLELFRELTDEVKQEIKEEENLLVGVEQTEQPTAKQELAV